MVIVCYCCIFYAFRTPEKKRKSEKTAWELNLKSAVASADLRKFRTTERSKPSDHTRFGQNLRPTLTSRIVLQHTAVITKPIKTISNAGATCVNADNH